MSSDSAPTISDSIVWVPASLPCPATPHQWRHNVFLTMILCSFWLISWRTRTASRLR